MLSRSFCAIAILFTALQPFGSIPNRWVLFDTYVIAAPHNNPACHVSVVDVTLQKKGEWPMSLAIAVKNTSTKPIYFISGMIDFPDSHSIEGPSIGAHWGQQRFHEYLAVATINDSSLKPGESSLLTIESNDKLLPLLPQAGDKAVISIQFVNFGDGSGWSIMTGGSYRDQRNSR